MPLKHAYTLAGVKQVTTAAGTTHRLFLVKNPWRKDNKFTGKWNDDSSIWTESLLQQTKHTKGNDGYMWLEDFEMFLAFPGLQIADLRKGFYTYYSVEDHKNDG